MNKIVKLSLVTTLATLSLNAATTNADLLKKIDAMQKQINQLQSSQADENDDLEDRIDAVETSTMVDKINFGLEFRTRVDDFKQQDAKGYKSSDNNIWSNRLRLNMRSKISDNMNFIGRLTMYKNWADEGQAYMYSGMDTMQGRRPSNSGLFVERAYVNWRVEDSKLPLVLTIGRQPSSDGPSHQFKDNTVRKSTYSALSFDGAADGIVATLPLNKLTSIDGMALRFGYGKGFQNNTNSTYVGNSQGISDSNVLGAFFESGLGVDGSLFQLSAVKAYDVASMIPKDNKIIGNVKLYTAMLEFVNIANTNLDLFAHYAISQATPNGSYSLMDTTKTPSATNPPLGLLTSIPGDKAQKDGSAYWLGARYTLPIKAMKNPRIGVEYNHGSQNWFSFTQGSNDLTNKLATRGSATEVYYIQPINRYAHLRLGATQIDYDYTSSGYQVGTPMSMADVTTMSPTPIKSLTNIYLLFNLAY